MSKITAEHLVRDAIVYVRQSTGVRQGLLRHSAAAKRTAQGRRAEWTNWLRR
jgi:hypothetical protein